MYNALQHKLSMQELPIKYLLRVFLHELDQYNVKKIKLKRLFDKRMTGKERNKRIHFQILYPLDPLIKENRHEMSHFANLYSDWKIISFINF